MSEKLSAFVDNELEELERARVLRELGQDRSLTELWSRYHIIGLAMRREPIIPTGCIAERVSSRLGDEWGEPVPARLGNVLQPARRFAVAASVAGVLLIGGLVVKLYEDYRAADTVSATPQIAAVDDATRWEGVDREIGVDPEIEDALNALLVEHGEFTSASGMNGLTAYTKFVAYDSR